VGGTVAASSTLGWRWKTLFQSPSMKGVGYTLVPMSQDSLEMFL